MWTVFLLLFPLCERNGSLVQQAALLRGGEMAPRHDPIGGLSSRCTVPRGIPLLDKPRAGSQGEPSERHWCVKHTQLRRGTRAAVPFHFPILSFSFLFFFEHVLVRDWKTSSMFLTSAFMTWNTTAKREWNLKCFSRLYQTFLFMSFKGPVCKIWPAYDFSTIKYLVISLRIYMGSCSQLVDNLLHHTFMEAGVYSPARLCILFSW